MAGYFRLAGADFDKSTRHLNLEARQETHSEQPVDTWPATIFVELLDCYGYIFRLQLARYTLVGRRELDVGRPIGVQQRDIGRLMAPRIADQRARSWLMAENHLEVDLQLNSIWADEPSRTSGKCPEISKDHERL